MFKEMQKAQCKLLFFSFFFNPLPFCEAYNMARSCLTLILLQDIVLVCLLFVAFVFYSYLPLHSKNLPAPALWTC